MRPTSSNTMSLMSAIEPQRAYNEFDYVRLLRLPPLAPPCSFSSAFPFLLFSSRLTFCSFSSFASPPPSCLLLPSFSPALPLLRLYLPRHFHSLSSSLVFLFFTLLLPVTYPLPNQHLHSPPRRLTPTLEDREATLSMPDVSLMDIQCSVVVPSFCSEHDLITLSSWAWRILSAQGAGG